MTKQTLGIFAAAVVVGGGLIWLFAGEPAAAPTEDMDETTDGMTEEVKTLPPVVWNDSLEAQDQDAGTRVIVQRVTLTEDAWVVVHEQWPNGARGNALGAALVTKDATGAAVELLRGTTAGNRYEVLIYSDDGDRMFDLKKDTIRMNASGSAISATFFALATGIEGLTE